jgi:FMN-dependent oxidoreductase (nitrilotriacetate monooxygenase family)
MASRQLHFTAFIYPAGYHESAWRVVDAEPGAVLRLPYYAEIARIAEAGALDALFVADNMAIPEFRVEYMPQTQFDPVALLSALAGVTERIGLIGTGSTTYSAPWDLARRFATLDFISGGRAGWNVVTTRSVLTAANFGGSEHPAHAERYEQAAEFVEVVRQLWDGWEDGAVVGSKEAGIWADPARLHAPHFHGEHFQVAGVLPIPRSPQGQPVLVQAGSSGAGINLAAHIAELVFTRQPTIDAAVGFREEVRSRASAAGRAPDHIHVLPALVYTLGSTEAEARERQEQLEASASSDFRWRNMLWMIGLDPAGFDPDAPLPDALLDGPPPSSGAEPVFALARRERLALRELAERLAGLPNSMTFVGTPEQLAEFVERWWQAGAADGFTLMPNTLPDGLATFVEHVLPILRRRGAFRTEYSGITLRDHLGLPRPPGRIRTALGSG